VASKKVESGKKEEEKKKGRKQSYFLYSWFKSDKRF
jgi:hypothetical protein